MKNSLCMILAAFFVAQEVGAVEITVIHAGWLFAVPGTTPVEQQSIIIENDRVNQVSDGFVSRSEPGGNGSSATTRGSVTSLYFAGTYRCARATGVGSRTRHHWQNGVAKIRRFESLDQPNFPSKDERCNGSLDSMTGISIF